jgi:cysteinyl-tRNA synthetase
MSMKYLGETLDIHTGGIDHLPVHHTNEIAQSEAATGKQFARYWLHSNHVLVDGEKISKSLGNGIRLQEIMQEGITPEAVRLHVLESHYRSQSKFSMESLKAAQNRLQTFKAMAALRWQALEVAHDGGTFTLEDVPIQLASHIQNDLNTPQALAFLSEVATQLNVVLIEKDMLDHFKKMLQGIDDVLGLKLMDVQDISDEQKALLKERTDARESGNWARSDEIRDKLSAENIGVRDTPYGAIWFPL